MEKPTEPTASLESAFFRGLNRLVEPAVRHGIGSVGFVPTGFVVLETTGRVSGLPRRVPVAATLIGDHVLVSTLRGARSQWLSNLRSNPEVRYWLFGRPRSAHAVVLGNEAATHELAASRFLRCLAVTLGAPMFFGVSFAILVPSGKTQSRSHRTHSDV